jgi:hypothetical protein
MKTIKCKELNVWVVAEYNQGDEQLPQLTAFNTREEAREYTKGNKPSLLSKFKLFFELDK